MRLIERDVPLQSSVIQIRTTRQGNKLEIKRRFSEEKVYTVGTGAGSRGLFRFSSSLTLLRIRTSLSK